MSVKRCKDCLPDSKRPAPHPGPRCTTHHRAVRKARSAAQHDKRVQAVYGLAPGDYERLLAAQGGTCAIGPCRASGKTKRLAVDHDHKTGEVRGLLCGPHNQAIGFNRDNPEAFRSLAEYLENPPARGVLDLISNPQVTSSNDE